MVPSSYNTAPSRSAISAYEGIMSIRLPDTVQIEVVIQLWQLFNQTNYVILF